MTVPEGWWKGRHGPDDPVARAKQEVRERMWRLLEERGVARFPGAWGRIPNFQGAEEAARCLAALPEWRAARVLKANPDAAQLPVRARALAEGKRLYVAVPRLRDERPFLVLEPGTLRAPSRRAATIRGAATLGRPVRVDEVEPVDLVVCGSVAVNPSGVRVGKGGGFSDLEFGLLVEAGLVGEGTVIATTVHPLQVVDEDLPETEHDFRVDLVVTPAGVIRPPRARRPPGILWEHLSEEKVAEVPALAAARGG